MSDTDWFNDLKSYTTECRRHNPLPCRDRLSLAEEMQCRIIGGSLLEWLQNYGPHILQERAVLAKLHDWSKDPCIVFTSEQPGLIAASEILHVCKPTITCLLPEEFTRWLNIYPDPDYRWHIHTWSYFATLDVVAVQKARQYPLTAKESYWLHKEGTMCGSLFGFGGDHLWKWNGSEPTLLEECFSKWCS